MSKKSSTFAVPFEKNGVVSRSRAVVARQAHNLKVGGSIPPSATQLAASGFGSKLFYVLQQCFHKRSIRNICPMPIISKPKEAIIDNLLLSYALIIPAGFGCKKSTPHGMLFDFAVKLFVEN